MIKRLCDNLYMVFTDPASSLVYILIDDDGRKCFIDAGLGRIEEPPDLCILTHNHLDHTKGASNWKNVYMHELDMTSVNSYSYVPENTKPLKSIAPNDMFSFGDFTFTILHVPGHTPGSIALYDEDKRILFSGDTWFGNGWYGRTDLGGNEDDLLRSVELLKSLDVKLLCPGHLVL